MSTALERVTITMPTEMTAVIRQAVDHGEYASTSEVVCEAVREWKIRRQVMQTEQATLKATSTKGWLMSPPDVSVRLMSSTSLRKAGSD